MFLGLPWFDGMNVGGCIAKGLVEFVVLRKVAGKHVGGRVDPQGTRQVMLPHLWGKVVSKGRWRMGVI